MPGARKVGERIVRTTRKRIIENSGVGGKSHHHKESRDLKQPKG